MVGLKKVRVALVYDRVNKWGGAERVLLALHKIFPTAPLYTSVYDRQGARWADVFDIKTSFLQKFPYIKKHNELFPFLMPIAFESFNFDDYDLVLSVTSESAKGIITKPKTIHICLCLTPTRYLWSGYSVYFRNSLLRQFLRPITSYLRTWDLIASRRPDIYIAISDEVKKRIRKYYNRDSARIYPPVMMQIKGIRRQPSDYFLLVSRLSKFVSYKKADIVVEAFNELGLRLRIVGSGSLMEQLQKIAKSNIEFLGQVNDEELEELYKNSRALIFPGVEDFGLVMAEAQSVGTPVIAFRGGGAMEIIEEGISGEFFNEQTKASLIDVLKNFDESRYNREAIKEDSQRFSFLRFQKEILNFIDAKT